MEKPSAGIKEQQGLRQLINFNNIDIPKDEGENLEGETFLNIAKDLVAWAIQTTKSITKNGESFYTDLRECLLSLPPLETMDNPITISNIVNHQSTHLPLERKIHSDPNYFQHEELEGYEVIHTRSWEDDIWKITIPNTLLPQLLTWYHIVLGHCGQQRLSDTVRARFQANNLQKSCIHIVNWCPHKCQMNKQSNKVTDTFLPE